MKVATHWLKAKGIGMMDLKATRMLMFMWFVMLSYEAISGKKLSREEDAELNWQLKFLNRPAVETIQTKYGDTYHCVDFYQQPAFDHPLLKDHKFQFQMKRDEKNYNRKGSSRNFFEPEKFWLNGKGCPFGTVPIKNVTKNDLTRAKVAAKIYSSKLNAQSANNRPGVKYAVLHTSDYPHKKYYGGFMMASLYNQQVQNNQYSSIQMKLQNGLDTIIVGSTVNPMVYKDHKTRLFIYTTTDNTQCFNNWCSHPLFILTSRKIPLDMVFPETSMRGNTSQIGYRYFIYKDEENGNYYLKLDKYGTEVGLWPQKLFKSLADSASVVEWGGEVYSPPGVPSPPMGSGGAHLRRSIQYDAFCLKIKVVDEHHQIVNPSKTKVYEDKPYHGLNFGDVGGEYGYLFIFGGNGTP